MESGVTWDNKKKNQKRNYSIKSKDLRANP